MKFILVAAFVVNLALAIAARDEPFFFLFFLSLFLYYGYEIFGNSMNVVQNLGPLYWIVRNNGKKGNKVFSTGFMRQLSEPWLQGKGLQFRVSKYTLQVGFCRPHEYLSEEYGVLGAMGGFYMSDTPKEISKWR